MPGTRPGRPPPCRPSGIAGSSPAMTRGETTHPLMPEKAGIRFIWAPGPRFSRSRAERLPRVSTQRASRKNFLLRANSAILPLVKYFHTIDLKEYHHGNTDLRARTRLPEQRGGHRSALADRRRQGV